MGGSRLGLAQWMDQLGSNVVLGRTTGLMLWWFALSKFQTTHWDGVGWGSPPHLPPTHGVSEEEVGGWDGGNTAGLRVTQRHPRLSQEADPRTDARL